MQKLRFKLRIEDLTTSDEAMARLLAAGSARREIGDAGGTPRRDWHRQNFACPRDPQLVGTSGSAIHCIQRLGNQRHAARELAVRS